MNTFLSTEFLGAGAATNAQATIYTAPAERPRIITLLRVFNNSTTARWIKAWMNGAQICDFVVDPKNVINLTPSPMGLAAGQVIDIQGEVNTVLLWQLHGS